MARSTYIYVVKCGNRRESVLFAATVKHELRTWLRHQTRTDLSVSRHYDGLEGTGTIMLIEDILAGK